MVRERCTVGCLKKRCRLPAHSGGLRPASQTPETPIGPRLHHFWQMYSRGVVEEDFHEDPMNKGRSLLRQNGR